MSRIGEMIAASATPGILMARRLLAGVTPQNYARLARPGGVVVPSNHAAFVLGHLALYPARTMERLGRRDPGVECPAAYVALFEAGVECRDDPDGSIYPSLEELSERYFSGYEKAQRAVHDAADEVFSAPNPAEGRSREMLPTLGAVFAFYLGGHVMNHLGQLSAWRRCLGLPPA